VKEWWSRERLREYWHFGWIGAVNTAATFALFQLLLFAMGYGWAYTLSFLAGIPFAFVLNSRITFAVELEWSRIPAFALVYGGSYLLGLGVLAALVEWAGIDERPASVLQLVITVPPTFVLSRLVLTR